MLSQRRVRRQQQKNLGDPHLVLQQPFTEVLVPCLPAEQQQAHKYRKRIKVNWLGCIVMFIYLVALIFYIWVRVTKTLGLGKYTW